MNSISIFEIFKIGLGPSSSHAMGPWNAAKDFLYQIKLDRKSLKTIINIDVELYGSLAKTGIGHGTDKAIMMGLCGYDIEIFNAKDLNTNIERIENSGKIILLGEKEIQFIPKKNIIFNREDTSFTHPNMMKFIVEYSNAISNTETYFSIGGGFIEKEGKKNNIEKEKAEIPFPVETASDMIHWCELENKTIAQISLDNEMQWNNKIQIYNRIDFLWKTMLSSIYEGCTTTGTLPGGLNVERRAAQLCHDLLGLNEFSSQQEWMDVIQKQPNDMETVMKWVSCYALAVNEVNASYGKIVTAPTNGAAGVIPSVLLYDYIFRKKDKPKNIREFFLVAGEIGMLFKKGATISAAAGGCQAEIGVSSAMAAGALANSMGGNIHQVLMAAEIAMEHHLGLSCDPIGGLVQIPCIERNTMGAIKAITAAQLSCHTDPSNAKVSLDDVIKTMWETSKDMLSKYKETSEGGLALQIPINQAEC